jgi:hypothetical protein
MAYYFRSPLLALCTCSRVIVILAACEALVKAFFRVWGKRALRCRPVFESVLNQTQAQLISITERHIISRLAGLSTLVLPIADGHHCKE